VPVQGDPALRFAGRADDYVRGRPGYPEALFDLLAAETGLPAGATVGDLGAGTGLSSEPWLARGFAVTAVEPSAPMRRAAVERLGARRGFRAVDGRAEATGLAGASVDLVFAAQAFHWFDAAAARVELARILREPRRVALAWNARRADGTPFLRDYEALLERFGTDYREVGHRGVGDERLRAFFGGPFERRRFDNAQSLDLDGLRARLLSSSYVPEPGAAGHAEMLAELSRIFDRHRVGGLVRIDYDTDLRFGRLEAA
jgi:SAM-dependent methyltransferase